MNFKTILAFGLCSAALAGTIIPTAAQAAQSIGTIDLELNVTNACVVNGASSVAANFGSGGKILFADQPGLFGNVDAQLSGSGGSAISVLCSPGAGPSMTVGSGAHDNNGQRYMASGSNSMPYRLFTDAARTDEIAVGRQISLGTATSSPITVPIYARVNSGGSVMAAGKYTDVVQVTLSW